MSMRSPKTAGLPWRGFQADNPLRSYGVALLSVLLSLGLRWLLAPLLGGEAPLLAFVLAVLLAAWYGGLGPGLLATGLSALAGTWFFIPPTHDFIHLRLADLVRLTIFLVIGVSISVLNGHLGRARRRVTSGRQALSETEEKLRQLAGTLERRVEERTAQLEEANRAMQAFAYSVSHDLRAPLRGIHGFSQALLEDYAGELDPAGQEFARRIVAAAERMELLINDILTYSRVSQGEVELRPVNLDQVVEEARQAVEPDLRGRGGEVSVDASLAVVQAHRSTLFQAVTNLLSNAAKFVAPGTAPQIRVWSEPREGWVRLWVEDNGIGIAPEHQRRIFEVFERLHGMETYPGTGVGLAVVRKGVERMGGRVGVESSLGGGSRFWIDLPRPERSA